jgi:leucyl/phenylalanyl-tRNA--protein transferase
MKDSPSDSLTVEDLLTWYEQGVFPMADARDDDRVFLIDPQERGVIPLGGFHVPRRLARTVRQDLYQVRIDTAFDQVVAQCAAPRPDRPDTWINRPIQRLYRELFARGFCHSVECWSEGVLVGGLYGVSLGGAFFGESMFSTARDASKVALVHLVARLKVGRYHLLDTQFLTEHLAQFGAVDILRNDYRRRLNTALDRNADFYLFPAYADGEAALQAIGLDAGGISRPA